MQLVLSCFLLHHCSSVDRSALLHELHVLFPELYLYLRNDGIAQKILVAPCPLPFSFISLYAMLWDSIFFPLLLYLNC